jgi:predicted RNA-binding Zn-ribbon protein involved in translation (DUF1610 family)
MDTCKVYVSDTDYLRWYQCEILMNSSARPDCPKCGMLMIVTKDFAVRPDKRTYECLRCGHIIEPPTPPPKANKET